jgi:hypothetical protein
MLTLDYPAILALFQDHVVRGRSESAAFLIWYLENYYHLDRLSAVDSVCDQRGDKGVDGIFVNDNDLTITVFQSRLFQRNDRHIGSAALREFAGTLVQFETADAIAHLIQSAGNAAVARLAERLQLTTKSSTHELRGEFVSNVNIDDDGADFLTHAPQITFVGKSALVETYVSDEREQPVHTPVIFDIEGILVSEYIVNMDTKATIAPIRARELVAMDGIANQSIFRFNVRGPLGKTKVNKDIVATIRDASYHKLFPLFHNGITVVAGEVDVKDDTITVNDYFVVNGCQSLTSLHDNQASLTDDLRVLVKFIRMDPRSEWAERITKFSNNQNGVRPRDFVSNHAIQIRLQNEFIRYYPGDYAFEIKQGEKPQPGKLISNEQAGLYLLAFDLKQPWATHRRYEVFEDRYVAVFARPEVTADRIVLCHTIVEVIEEHLHQLENQLVARYVLTKYMLLYVIREIIEKDGLAEDVLTRPLTFVRAGPARDRFRECIGVIVNDVIVDMNHELEEYGDDFDYRGRLRDEKWVRNLARRIIADYQKLVARGRIRSFQAEWEGASGG